MTAPRSPADGTTWRLFLSRGVPVREQELLFSGRKLDDTQTLADYNFTPTTGALHLVQRRIGAAAAATGAEAQWT